MNGDQNLCKFWYVWILSQSTEFHTLTGVYWGSLFHERKYIYIFSFLLFLKMEVTLFLNSCRVLLEIHDVFWKFLFILTRRPFLFPNPNYKWWPGFLYFLEKCRDKFNFCAHSHTWLQNFDERYQSN